MQIAVQQLERIFEYNGMVLQDPGSEFSVNDVRDTFAIMYPELTTASIEGPTFKGESVIYKFVRNVGTKG